MNRHNNEVLIVGAGAVGLACAIALLEAGRQVHVIDAGDVGGGSSHGNCGTITPSHSPPLAAPGTVLKALKWILTPDAPLYVAPRIDPMLWRWLMRFGLRCNARDWRASAIAKAAMLIDSRQRIAEWIERYDMRCEFTASGEDYVFRDPQTFQAELKQLPFLGELGIGVEAIDGAAYQALEPALKPGLVGALRFDGDAALRPNCYVAELARVARELGGTIDAHCALRDAQPEPRQWRIQTTHGVHHAREVILAAGAWSPLLARQFGLAWLRHAIQPGKGYSITYDPPGLVPRRPLTLRDRSVCVTAWESGYRLGSTMEFSGYDTTLNARRLAALERAAHEYLRDPVGPVVRERWFGWRPMCVDDVPIIGAAPGKRGLWLATGHGMMGIGMSATSGRLLADLIVGCDPVVNPAPYRPARFV